MCRMLGPLFKSDIKWQGVGFNMYNNLATPHLFWKIKIFSIAYLFCNYPPSKDSFHILHRT